MAANPLLNFCKTQQWKPRHLDEKDDRPSTAEQVANEAKAALNAGKPDTCLGLIKIAQALDLHSVEQLELKAAAHILLQRQPVEHDPEPNTNNTGNTNQTLRSELWDACAARHWSPQFLSDSQPDEAMAELETKLLKEAEIARNNGALELALVLLDLALQHGCSSLWIQHSKALVLSRLQRFDLAHTLWEELIQHDNEPAFVSAAKEAYQASEQREQHIRATPLLEALIGRIQQDHLQPEVLPLSGELNEDTDLQTLILQEAEKQRNHNQTQLSVDLLDISINYGCDSLWLFHNKALGLQKLGQLEAAIGIWKGLLHHEIEGFINNIRSDLGSAEQELILQRAHQAEATGSLEIAIDTLTSALLNHPEQEAVETSLKAILRKRRHENTGKGEIEQLEANLDDLELNHVFLMKAIEQLNNTHNA